ncbi:MAG: D-alanine--D-alanine ligase, partial [Ottowia sp.]|nr:D-alanine--D-alanine ligase [Ottowia sp.]
LGIPYTGSGVMASSIAIDKVMTKRVWGDEGLPVPQQMLLRAGHIDDARLTEAVQALGLPLIVKPSREGSSLGVTKVTDAVQMRAAVDAAAALDMDVMCEQFISGEELTCPVLGAGDAAHALPVIRIAAPDGNYDFQHKYFSNDTQYLIPSGLPPAEEQAVQQLCVQAYRALGCRGWGRVDVMLDAATRRPFLLEINTSPGMTGHSLVPMAARAVGIDYEELCLRLLAGATLDYAREEGEGA